jgi:hypothetical protein
MVNLYIWTNRLTPIGIDRYPAQHLMNRRDVEPILLATLEGSMGGHSIFDANSRAEPRDLSMLWTGRINVPAKNTESVDEIKV